MDTLLLSKNEAAQLLGVSLRTIEKLISRGEIPARRIGKRVLIQRSAVESFAASVGTETDDYMTQNGGQSS